MFVGRGGDGSVELSYQHLKMIIFLGKLPAVKGVYYSAADSFSTSSEKLSACVDERGT